MKDVCDVTNSSRHHDELFPRFNHYSIPNERIQEKCPTVKQRFAVPIGWVVCLLPPSVVVSSPDVYRFKWCHGCLNALALIIVAAGIVVGSVLENSLLTACLTAAGTVIKGWNDFKKFSFKIDMCRFAYTTYDKTLIELRTYVRGLPMEEFEGFLIKMQTLDDTITDFTPPVSDKCVQQYEQRFHYDHVDKSSSTYV